ncbi:MAG TPA: hypothetical protein VM253_11400, partial [Candidatus Limnocylindrales bacterium]|nr:hypothetical protein [Candidatus Limnocylindrales bacterium]
MPDVPLRDVGEWHLMALAVPLLDHDPTADGPGDSPDGAVHQAEPPVVPRRHHPVADGELQVPGHDQHLAQLAGRHEAGAGTSVEVGHIAAVMGEHHGVGAGSGGKVPVAGHAVPDAVRRRVRREAAGATEAQHHPLDVATAEILCRGPLDVMALPAVLLQLRVPERLGQDGEQTARVDLRQLLRVADEHELGARRNRVADESRQPPAAQHPRFVDDHDAADGETAPAGVEVAEQAVGGVGGEAGAGLH